MELKCAYVWAQISLSALEHNYRALRAMLSEDCRLLGVVKADAYGHGLVPVARKLVSMGCEMLAVACLNEALVLRQSGITAPVLIFGPTQPEFASQVVEHDITQTVFTQELGRALSCAAVEQGKKARVHIKLDTGMGRIGVLAHDSARAAAEVAQLCALPGLDCEGIFTHFANADADEEYTMLQFTRFLDTVERLEKDYGITFPVRHCASSAAALQYPCTHLDMIRPGLAMYGHYPAPSCEQSGDPELIPVMSLCARVAVVRELPAGTAVSYGCSHVVKRDSRVAVLPIGYGDGLPRLLSDRFQVEFNGRKAPILGRVCMDMCMVDVTDLPEVKQGDTAVIFGAEKPLQEAAQLAGTITYELLCGVMPRVPRIYVE